MECPGIINGKSSKYNRGLKSISLENSFVRLELIKKLILADYEQI